MARKLRARGYADDTVAATLGALVAQGLLSNSRYAESFVHSRFQRGQGPLRIRAELRERGIDDGLIDACLEAYATRWKERIEQVRLKKFGPERPDSLSERNRQMRFLLQRGFTAEQVGKLFRGYDRVT